MTNHPCRTIGAFEAKTRLSELLRDTEKGYTYIIMRRGKAVARLAPVDDSDKKGELGKLICSFHKIRSKIASSVDVRALVEEGRRR